MLSTILFGCGSDNPSTPLTTVYVPDTGQTQSYTSLFGQDSDYLLHPPSYSDNGNETITDNVTGLMWQKGGNAANRSSTEADEYCAGLTLAHFTDWRLPSDYELMTIVDYGTTAPAINGIYFPNTRFDSPWWTRTQGMSSSFAAGRWAVYFGTGNMDILAFYSSAYTRCVRGGKKQPGAFAGTGQDQPHDFWDNGNGTITDRITRLVWQKQDRGTTASWEDAITACEESALGGYSDWRLPNVKELRSIVNSGMYAPAAYDGYFPNTQSNSYWSSTTYVTSPDAAWRVNFWHGEVEASLKGNAFFVRCVRGGQ
jgi:hypothetical protein